MGVGVLGVSDVFAEEVGLQLFSEAEVHSTAEGQFV